MKVERALLSVSNKGGLREFAQCLKDLGVEIYATTGTASFLAGQGVIVRPLNELTGLDDCVGGRVKTLHPAIHGAILARRDVEADMADLEKLQVKAIDMVVCNLYPFAATKVESDDVDELRELIDIGGTSMLRAAAKNWPYVASVSDPEFYGPLMEELSSSCGYISHETLQELSRRTFEITAAYDRAIARWMAEMADGSNEDSLFPRNFKFDCLRHTELKYGENPHQKAALYVRGEATGIAGASRLQGDVLSYNNLLDADAAWRAIRGLNSASAVVVKHGTPCGMACGGNLADALSRALAGDPKSAFGGVIAVNREFTEECALSLRESKIFTQMLVAPSFSAEARTFLSKKKRMKLLAFEHDVAAPIEIRTISGGLLVQEADNRRRPQDWKVVGKTPLREEMKDKLPFAWQAVRAAKSNAVVITQELELVGVGAGQSSRVDAVAQALDKAGDRAKGGVMASDAFFPFADSIKLAAAAGIRVILQPGGSKRDGEVVKAADEAHICMVFTERRCFRH